MNVIIKPRIFTEKVILAIVGAIVTISTMLSAYMTVKINQKADVNTAKIDTLHSMTNGKMEKLLELTETSAKAEGKLEQKTEQDSIEEVKK